MVGFHPDKVAGRRFFNNHGLGNAGSGLNLYRFGSGGEFLR
jgi:hypothetical protein